MASLLPHAGPLGERLAAHLLRRSTFGFTAADLASYANKTASQAVDDLLNFPTVPPPPPVDPQTGQTWVGAATNWNSSNEGHLKKYVVAWWLEEAFSNTNLLHKMMLFLHQNFANDLSTQSVDIYYQLRLIRYYAKGSYKTLAEKMCMDNGMLVYLNTQQSSGINPNENFPRELLELFTIGKGDQIAPGNYTTYTEDDIKEAARLFTGYRVDYSYSQIDNDTSLPRGNPNPWQHDQTPKTFSAAFQNTVIQGGTTDAGMLQEVSDFITMVFNQDATAENICRKLYRFFVHYKISSEVETDIILPLSQTLKTNNYDLEVVIKELLKSEHFFDKDDNNDDDEIIGGVVKNPLELFIGTMRYFDVQLPDKWSNPDQYYRSFFKNVFLDYLCLEAGMDVYNPIDVAGYPAYYQQPAMDNLWVSGSTLSFRYLFADMLLQGTQVLTSDSLQVQLNVMDFVNDPVNIPAYTGVDPFGNTATYPGPQIATHLVSSIINALLPKPLSSSRLSYFLDDLLLDNLTEANWYFEWRNYVQTGNDAMVKPQIEKLIRGILQSPEYQLG